MSDALRWVLGAVAVLLVVCLLVWARGDDHMRGDDVGALEATHSAAGQ